MLTFEMNDKLVCAGQPNADELGGLAAQGYKTVVNLRAAGEPGMPDNEAELVEAQGIKYVHFPVAGGGDINVDKAKGLAEILGNVDGKALVHCGSSNRVGALLALNAKHADGKNTEEALAYGRKAGLSGLEDHVRGLLDG